MAKGILTERYGCRSWLDNGRSSVQSFVQLDGIANQQAMS